MCETKKHLKRLSNRIGTCGVEAMECQECLQHVGPRAAALLGREALGAFQQLAADLWSYAWSFGSLLCSAEQNKGWVNLWLWH